MKHLWIRLGVVDLSNPPGTRDCNVCRRSFLVAPGSYVAIVSDDPVTEAVVPLRGGAIPVALSGAGGPTVHLTIQAVDPRAFV